MNYPLKNNFGSRRHSRGQRKTWVFSFVLLFLILIFSVSYFRSFVFWLGRPLWKMEVYVSEGLSNSWSLLNAKRDLVEENRKLREENQKMNYYLLANDYLTKENADLQESLGRKSKKGQMVLAYVLVKPGQTPYDQIIVDAGNNFGISVGDLVATEGSVVLGEVTEVFGNSAKVELYSTPNKTLTVLIGSNNIQAQALGVGSGNFRVKLPKEADVKEGDSIIIPSISQNIFGVVEKIDTNSVNTFQDIYFKNPVNLSELKYVEILKNKDTIN